MKAIMVMFDSLNRHMLPPYGCEWTIAPNFERLAERTVVFDNCFVGSMPCIPARRELHTGRYNFLHRSWGPIEPFDNSMPELLKNHGVYTHLATDHQHYWEDGGCTYHSRYNTWEFSRGQEGDTWKAEVADPEIPKTNKKRIPKPWRQDWVNRKYISEDEEFPQAKTFSNGIEFIRTNHQEDNWFLQIETFDPHEPYFSPEKFKKLYPHDYDGAHLDLPDYNIVTEGEEEVHHLRYEYAALLSMCDHYLGKVLDLMDELDLWKDTFLIVNTDHGFLLSEHGLWAKNFQPLYNEIAHIPLFIYDPRCGKKAERRKSLVQMIDIAPTLLEFFGVPIPKEVQGFALKDTIKNDQPVREACIFGYHGCHINVTDGRYVYMRGPQNPENQPLFEYTLMPTHIKSLFSVEEMQNIQLVKPFNFSKGVRLLKIGGLGSIGSINPYLWGSMLFDLKSDPGQEHPIQMPEVEERMLKTMVELMRQSDAPAEQYQRMGLPFEGDITSEHLTVRERVESGEKIGNTPITWISKGKKMFFTLNGLIPFWARRQFQIAVEKKIAEDQIVKLDENQVLQLFIKLTPETEHDQIKLMAGIIEKHA
jgi:arylsulfatase A-like enzyme